MFVVLIGYGEGRILIYQGISAVKETNRTRFHNIMATRMTTLAN